MIPLIIDKKDFDYSKVIETTAPLKVIRNWYNMEHDAEMMTSLRKADSIVCVNCVELIETGPVIRCAECYADPAVILCLVCFKLGAELGNHKRGHNYRIIDYIGKSMFEDTDSENQWGCFEDLHLLNTINHIDLNHWEEVSKELGKNRTCADAFKRLDERFLRGFIGKFIRKDMDLNNPNGIFFLNNNNSNENISPTNLLSVEKEPSVPKTLDLPPKSKYNKEDFELLGYMPFRQEFEHQFLDKAETMVSTLNFDVDPDTKLKIFLNDIRTTRIHAYNRILKMRNYAQKTIEEHDIVNEYVTLAKNYISMKDHYAVLPERCFKSIQARKYYEPLFMQMRQLTNKSTLVNLAKNISYMEYLREKMDELIELKEKGVKKLDSKFYSITNQVLHRRRKNKKETPEQRKALLRWNQLKRWNKKNYILNGL